MKSFKIRENIKEAWLLFKNNLSTFFLILALLYVAESVSEKENIILSIIVSIVGIFVSYMIIKFLLSIIDKKEFNIFSKKSFPTLKQLWRFFATYIIVAITGMGSFLVFFIPAFFILSKTIILTSLVKILFGFSVIGLIVGIYFAVRLMFALFIVIDKEKGIIESIKESWSITKGHFWKIFWKTFLIELFMVVGFLLFFVGAFITYPMGMILFTMLYRHFKNGEIIKEAELIRE